MTLVDVQVALQSCSEIVSSETSELDAAAARIRVFTDLMREREYLIQKMTSSISPNDLQRLCKSWQLEAMEPELALVRRACSFYHKCISTEEDIRFVVGPAFHCVAICCPGAVASYW